MGRGDRVRAVWYDRQGSAREVLNAGELPTPAPGPGEVLVHVAASGVNPSDCNLRAGRFGRKMGFPRIVPHSDGAGTVAAVGAGVTHLRAGDRVWLHNASRGRAFGTAAEYVALDATLAAPLPKDLPFAHGACLGVPCMTAWLAVFGDGAVQGQRVLVTGGAGSVGFYAVQLASWGGAKVAATVSGEEKAAHARRAGAELVLNYRRDDVAGALREWSGGEGVARVVEVDLGANLPVTLEALRVGGVVSMYSSVAVPEPKLPALGFMFKNATVHFLQLGAMPLERRRAAQQGIARWHAEAAPIHRVAVKVPLAETSAAHEAVERGERLGAVVVEI